MQIALNVDSKAVLKGLNKFGDTFAKSIRIGMKEGMSIIQTQARKKHRFNARSGQLERSVQTSVSRSGLSGKAYLDQGIAVYGPRIHKGWGTWAADEFLYEAASKKEREVKKVVEEAINLAIKKAGF